ncbi:hypothetical protein ACH5RR_039785 [Cinchona calisaya]|uniref:Uncharacterized protein n=1 Tax=Cinchona calisaya TaxID=153742 RepID=A0ABD2Y2M3_9GENT
MKVKRVLEQSIQEFCRSINTQCIRVADLGCASGSNTFLAIREIIDCIDQEYQHKLSNSLPLSIQIFLNDLESNDFNTIFKSLPDFYEQLGPQSGRSCFIAAVPGSFYGRLFPDNFIHFVHSSSSLHWLSEIPRGLVTETGLPLSKGNIYITKTSPSYVHDAYLDQFEKDFTNFLRMRAIEMVPCGHLLLTLHSRTAGGEGYCYQDILGMTLSDMVMEGLIKEATLDHFSLPLYEPSMEEVKHIIENEGSFKIRHLETIDLAWNDADIASSLMEVVSDKHIMGEYSARNVRVAFQHILASHFGEDIMDDLFCMLARKFSDHIDKMNKAKEILVVSLSKA